MPPSREPAQASPRRPIIGAALAWGLGVAGGLSLPSARRPLWIASALAACALGLLARHRLVARVRPTTVLQALLLVGMATLGWIRAERGARQQRRGVEQLRPALSARAEFEGVIVGDPIALPHRERPVTRCLFRVEQWRRADDTAAVHPARATIRVYLYGSSRRQPAFAFGQRWRWRGRLRVYPDPATPTDEDTGRPSYGRRERFTLHVGTRDRDFLAEAEGWRSVAQTLFLGRARAAEYLALGIEKRPRAVALLHALLLGRREGIHPQERARFVETGTWHIFAISGLHVGILVLLLVFVLRIAGISRQNWIFFLLPALAAYVWATGGRASALRAGLMAVVYFLAPRLRRRPDTLSALALAALLILVFAPAQLFDLGFVFSFVTVTGIILLYPPFHACFLRRLSRAAPAFARAPDAPRTPADRLLGLIAAAGRHLAALAALSCSAWIASAPLSLYFFGRVSPVALLANLIVVPLVFLIVLAGSLSLTFGLIHPLLAYVFNHINLGLLAVLGRCLTVLRAIPLGHLADWRIGPLWMALWYAFWLLAAYRVDPKRAHKDISGHDT
jgi:ComEC/Rec2-related protein